MPHPQPVPDPPYAEGTGLPWDVSVTDAVAAIAAARAQHGDTFAVHSGNDRYLFTFSPTGVESFYGLPEEKASKGVADYLMLRRKLPDEIFDGRRLLPSTLFRRDDVAGYLINLDRALDETIVELGASGSVDVFELTRRLGHRMGLASWAGPGSARGEAFERLVRAFDTLDGSDAFVHPDAMAAVAASEKRAERAALDEAAEIIADAVHRRDGWLRRSALFDRIVDAWRDELGDNRIRGIALDVALIHIASMSNLAAALGWALVDLLEHPTQLEQVVAGDADLAQRCALESTRLAQRSIMSRAVLSPVVLDTGDGQLRSAARLDHRNAAALAQHLRRTRTRAVGSGPMDAAPADRREVAALTDAGDGVRPRPAFVSGTAVFTVGDDSHDDAVVGHLSDDTGLDDAPATCSGSDRRRGTGRRALSPRLRPPLTSHRSPAHHQLGMHMVSKPKAHVISPALISHTH